MAGREQEIVKITLIGSVINALLIAIKLAAGTIAHSSAMIADGVHSLSDFLTDFVVIMMMRISGKPHDEDHDYGHGKYETLATAIIGLLLIIVGGGICFSGGCKIVEYLRGGTLTSPGWLAFGAAIVSILLKEGTYQYTIRRGRGLDSEALIANAWHHRSDALSSIGTAVGIGAACYMGDAWAILDPLAAIIVSIFIFRVAIRLLSSSLGQLLERSLSKEIEDKIEQIVHSHEGVCQMHHLRTRQIGVYYVISMHIRMDGSISLCEAHTRTTEIEDALRHEFGEQTIINIHTEPIKEANKSTHK